MGLQNFNVRRAINVKIDLAGRLNLHYVSLRQCSNPFTEQSNLSIGMPDDLFEPYRMDSRGISYRLRNVPRLLTSIQEPCSLPPLELDASQYHARRRFNFLR